MTTAKDPNTAFLIEFVGGFFGLLGLGYFYVGRTNDGVIRLIVWLVYLAMTACAITLLLAVLIGFLCIPIQLVIQVAVPLWSAYTLKNSMESPAMLPGTAGVPPMPVMPITPELSGTEGPPGVLAKPVTPGEPGIGASSGAPAEPTPPGEPGTPAA